jgi:GntR family transcriptional regulator/MocR family aminotransferase
VPPPFISKVTELCRVVRRGESTFEQGVVGIFMAGGHFAKHLQRMRMHYKARRQALADALELQFGKDIQLSLPLGGLQILARFPNHGGDVALADRVFRHGLKPSPLSTQSIEHSACEGLLMSFTNIPEKAASDIARTLRHALA